MLKRGLLILLLLLPLAIAQDNYNDVSDLTIQYDSEGEIVLDGSGGFSGLNAFLYLFPRESDRQEIISLTTNPSATQEESKLTYSWNTYKPSFDYLLSSEVKTKNNLYPISSASFPIKDLPEEYEEYLGAGEIIDITPAIVHEASDIVNGETDLYTATYKLGEWVNQNIEYDLNTLTSEAALKSSWVLENREGVCDEITSLFISLARSVGIPARFVSGVAYSNLNSSFENHGWAEVYFPGEGWVPYDITFSQLGWLDPGHLALDYSIDAGQPSVKYSWRSKNSELEYSNFFGTPQITDIGNKISSPFTISLEPLVNEVGPGSYQVCCRYGEVEQIEGVSTY